MNAGFSTVIRTSKRLASVCFLTAMFFAVTALPAFGQTTFSHDTGRCSGVNPLTIVGNPGDLLTEGYSSAPVVTISNANLGLDPDDEIDALSFGDDMSMQQTKNRMAVESRLRRAGRGTDLIGSWEDYTSSGPFIDPILEYRMDEGMLFVY